MLPASQLLLIGVLAGLSGCTQAPVQLIEATPAGLDFREAHAGAEGPAVTLQLRNLGETTTVVSDLSVDLPDAVRLRGPARPWSLAPGGTIELGFVLLGPVEPVLGEVRFEYAGYGGLTDQQVLVVAVNVADNGVCDEDGDGHRAIACGGSDCDDADAEQFPGAIEACNHIDDDCNGLIDEPGAVGEAFWYPDFDGDEHGDATGEVFQCDAPPHYISVTGDCDDADPQRHASLAEVCDGRDNDCDDAVDEDALNAVTTYVDADTDGYGDASAPVTGCEPAPGTVTDATDCNDADASVFPSAPEACNGLDDNCDGAIEPLPLTTFADVDGDGFGAGEGLAACRIDEGRVLDATDCNDADFAIAPSAVEHCDAVDEDCNGLVDDDPVDELVFFADADGDGWGDGAAPLWACAQPAGAVADGRDCDDSDGERFPGAEEVCDEVDNDCDWLVDEESGLFWHPDDDGDGFGDPSITVEQCVAPDGWTADAEDCDDQERLARPGAPELCDGIDQDCNGLVDDEPVDPTALWYADLDDDGYGSLITLQRSCEPLPDRVQQGGDCDDLEASVYPDALELCNGVDDDCNSAIDEACVTAEVCGNGIDDDEDGLVDCEDGDCADEASCQPEKLAYYPVGGSGVSKWHRSQGSNGYWGGDTQEWVRETRTLTLNDAQGVASDEAGPCEWFVDTMTLKVWRDSTTFGYYLSDDWRSGEPEREGFTTDCESFDSSALPTTLFLDRSSATTTEGALWYGLAPGADLPGGSSTNGDFTSAYGGAGWYRKSRWTSFEVDVVAP